MGNICGCNKNLDIEPIILNNENINDSNYFNKTLNYDSQIFQKEDFFLDNYENKNKELFDSYLKFFSKVKLKNGNIYTGYMIETDLKICDYVFTNDDNEKKGYIRHDSNGLMIDKYNNKYKGNFIKGIFNGYGIMFSNDGTTYKGYWKNNKCHGISGYLLKKNNFEYYGEFCDGFKHGYGKLIKFGLNNWKYKGSFKNNKFHGFGFLKWGNGAIYNGNFKNDKKDGFGFMKYPNGNIYEGEFKEDKKNGKGIFYNSKHDLYYEGTWKNGEIIKEGIVKNNKFEVIENKEES